MYVRNMKKSKKKYLSSCSKVIEHIEAAECLMVFNLVKSKTYQILLPNRCEIKWHPEISEIKFQNPEFMADYLEEQPELVFDYNGFCNILTNCSSFSFSF